MKLSQLAARILAAGALAAGALAAVAIAPVAQAVTSYTDIDCSTSTRMFQLRDNGSELWTGAISNAAATQPAVYEWTKAYEFSADRPALAVAAHSVSSTRILLFVTDAGGGLRSYNFDLAEKAIAGANNLRAPGTTTDPAPYNFSRLSSDGDMLYGIKSGKLYVMSGISGSAVPEAYAEVSGFSGWPLAFFNLKANTGRSVTWTDTSGALRHTTLKAGTNGWTATNKVLRSTGWGYSSITSPGAGLLLNDREDDLLWRQIVDDPTEGSSTAITTHQTIESVTGVPDARITTAQVCTALATPGALPTAPADNPHGHETTDGINWTPRAAFVNEQIEPRFPGIACSTYQSAKTSSDHHYGNALDCPAGTINEAPSSADRSEMDLLARWTATYAARLDVKYVIWERRIWHAGDPNPGTPSAWELMEDRGSIRENHFDHVHISVL